MGYVDDEGYLHLVDRKKDMIDSGGVKVYPKDVEEIAARHPAIREVGGVRRPARQVGRDAGRRGDPRRSRSATAAELRDWINERVAARYQRVSDVVIMKTSPAARPGRRSSGEMREPYWAGGRGRSSGRHPRSIGEWLRIGS